MSRESQEAAAVLDILASALKIVEQAIELGDTRGLRVVIERLETIAREEEAA